MNRVITHVLVTWPGNPDGVKPKTRLYGWVEYMSQGLHYLEDTVVRWLTAEEANKWGQEVRGDC